MKVSPEIIDKLNSLLASEHAAYVQYITHARMLSNWNYKKLVEYLTNRAEQEREHALELIDRILYLEGTPLFSEISNVNVGTDVFEMFNFDKDSELIAISDYIEGIELAVKLRDFGTRKLLEHILEEEESHLSEIEANMIQIAQNGIENYLPVQIGG